MKISIAAISVTLLGSVATAAQIETVKVQLYDDEHCAKKASTVDLKYNFDSGCGGCALLEPDGFKSFKVLRHSGSGSASLLLVSAFDSSKLAPCFSGGFVNTSAVEDKECTTTVGEAKGKKYAVHGIKLEYSEVA